MSDVTVTVIDELIGKVFTNVEHIKGPYEKLLFEGEESFKFHHNDDCCESVYIDDVVGDLSDLIGSPILKDEETTSSDESYTWTFYKFSTIKGYVDVKWYGTSNGYYSESVDFTKI